MTMTCNVCGFASCAASQGGNLCTGIERENLRNKAYRIARVLHEKLTDEEFDDLIDLDGDYITSDWLLRELRIRRGH